MSKRQEDARNLREFAWQLLRDQGRFQDVPPFGPHQQWAGHGIQMLLTTPFRRLPDTPRDFPDGFQMPETKKHQGYGLDIWVDARKTFSVQWDSADQLTIICYRRGEWEARLRELAQAGPSTGD